jgi:predicted amidohydrolase
MSDDPADAFGVLYDLIDEEVFLAKVQAWRAADATEVIAEEVERLLWAQAFSLSVAIRGMDAWPQHAQHICFAQLLGINRFLREANPYLTDVVPAELARISQRFEITGRFSTGAIDGAVLPRVPQTTDDGPPQEVADAFDAVVRVPHSLWTPGEHGVLPVRLRFSPAERMSVAVAAVAMMEDPGEISWQVDARDGDPVYRIELKDVASTRARIDALVDALHTCGAHIAVLPELAASPALLARWQAAIRARRPLAADRLRWLFIGTGNLDATDPPVNCGALLDALTGDVIATQRKRYRFDLNPDQRAEWKLPLKGAPSSGKLYEDLKRGRAITILETGWGRVAILVCEDLARVPHLGERMRSHGVSHMITPVFSKPTIEHYWEHSAAKPYAAMIGATVVVVNSIVVGRLQGESGPIGAALVAAPTGFKSAAADAADDILLFEVRPGLAPKRL